MTRTQIPVTRGNAGDDGDNVEFDWTSDSKKVQAVGLRATDDNKQLVPATTSDGMLVNLGVNNDVTVTSGTVTVGSALPAGTNAIGKLAANSGVNIGNVGHAVQVGSDNRKVVSSSGTAVPLAASSTPARIVTVVAETDNTGLVVVGSSTVVAALASRRGVPLGPGEAISMPCTDLSFVYIDAEVSGDGVTFLYWTAL